MTGTNPVLALIKIVPRKIGMANQSNRRLFEYNAIIPIINPCVIPYENVRSSAKPNVLKATNDVKSLLFNRSSLKNEPISGIAKENNENIHATLAAQSMKKIKSFFILSKL